MSGTGTACGASESPLDCASPLACDSRFDMPAIAVFPMVRLPVLSLATIHLPLSNVAATPSFGNAVLSTSYPRSYAAR